MLIKLVVLYNIFFLLGINGLFIFPEISVARSSSIEEKRCGGKLFSSRCILNAETLVPHFVLLFHLLHALSFLLNAAFSLFTPVQKKKCSYYRISH